MSKDPRPRARISNGTRAYKSQSAQPEVPEPLASKLGLPTAEGPAIALDPPFPQVDGRYHIKTTSDDVPSTTGLFHNIYSAGAVAILPGIIKECRKQTQRGKSRILNKNVKEVKALKGIQKTFVQEQINEYTKKPHVDRAKHMRKLIEGFIIKDPNHHCLRHNLEKLQGVDVRVNGERGLRAKRDLAEYQLLGGYNGEVLVQKEYDDNLSYDFTLGDNVRDDKTFTLWPTDDQAGDDPSQELVIVGRLACNLLALVNDPHGSEYEPNVFPVTAWNPHTEEVDMFYFVRKGGIKAGQELWLDYGPAFRRHVLYDEPARLASIRKLKSDIKALEARETHLRADLQEADLLRDGDSAKVKGLQAYVEECRAKISELQTAQGREASSSQAAKAQLQEERANWRGERKEWMDEAERLKAQLVKEEKMRLREQKVAVFEIAEAVSAQQAAEDKAKRVCIQMDVLRAAHDALHRPHQEAMSALQSQLDDQHASLRRAKRQLAEADSALADTQRERDEEASARAHLQRELRIMDVQLQRLEAQYRELRASARGEAGTRAAAERARAEAAAHAAAAETRQLKAVVAAQSADVETYRKQSAKDARAYAAAAAEIHRMREDSARKDADLKSAHAAAHQAATELARLMERDAAMIDPADQQLLMLDDQDADESAATEDESGEDSDEEETESGERGDLEEADNEQLQCLFVKPAADDMQPGYQTAMEIDEKPEVSQPAPVDQPAGEQTSHEHGRGLPASMNPQQQIKQESPDASETQSGEIRVHNQHEFGPATLKKEHPAQPDDDDIISIHSRDKDGSKKHRDAQLYIAPRYRSEKRRSRSRSRSPYRRPSPSRSSDSREEYRPRGRQHDYNTSSRHRHSPSQGLKVLRSSSLRRNHRSAYDSLSRSRERSAEPRQRKRSPSSRHRHSHHKNPKGARSRSPRRDRRSRHSRERKSSRRDRHRRRSSSSPADDYRSDRSRERSGQADMPDWMPGHFARPGQHEDSKRGHSLGAIKHAAYFVKQEQAEQKLELPLVCVKGETQVARYTKAILADPTEFGMRPWRPGRKSEAQRQRDREEYQRHCQIALSTAEKYKGALENAHAHGEAADGEG